MEVLKLLREYTIKKREIKYDKTKDELIFEHHKKRFPASINTPFRSKIKSTAYTAGAIWFMLKNQNEKITEYMRLCSAEKIQSVSYTDRTEMLDYLSGKIETSPNIKTDEPVLKKSKIEEEEEDVEQRKKPTSIEDVLAKERILNTRNTCLQTRTKPFKSILDVVQKSILEEEKKKKEAAQKEAQRFKKQQNYDRYETSEDKFYGEKGMGDLQDLNLDTRGTFDPTNQPFKDQGTSDAPKPDSEKKPIVKKERPQEKTENYKVPIIIVPTATTSLITQFNAADFLERGQYTNSVEKRDVQKKESRVTVTREKNGKHLKYQVADNPTKFTKEEWNRVVAVFAQGANWQFKNWEWKTPVEIFSKSSGFHLLWEDEPPSDLVKSWAVTLLPISRLTSKAHLAQTAQLFFWREIDDFLKKKKRNLFAPDYYL